MISIKIPIEPMTMNMAYSTSKTGRRFLTKKGKEYKAVIFDCLKQRGAKLDFDSSIHYFSAEYHFFTSRLWTKKGTLSKNKPDLSNCIKLTEDAVCSYLGIDDMYCLELEGVSQRYAKDSFIFVILRTHLQASLYKE